MKIAFDTKWLEAIGYLDDELRLTMLDAIFAYLQGQEPLLILEAQRVLIALDKMAKFAAVSKGFKTTDEEYEEYEEDEEYEE